MHSDYSDMEEEMYAAIALLHSMENDSTEKLKKMVDAAIEKRVDSDVYHFDNNDCNGDANESIEFISEKEDIPIISIPDEGSGDGAVCKICNDAKLGPLILIECQDCQETYHPLCHFPPIIDKNIHDPRFVWRCSSCCAKLNSPDQGSDNEVQEGLRKTKSETFVEQSRHHETSRRLKLEAKTIKDIINLREAAQEVSSGKRKSEPLQKNPSLKRRIGSKLTGRSLPK